MSEGDFVDPDKILVIQHIPDNNLEELEDIVEFMINNRIFFLGEDIKIYLTDILRISPEDIERKVNEHLKETLEKLECNKYLSTSIN